MVLVLDAFLKLSFPFISFFMMWNTDPSVSVLIYLAFLPASFFGVCEILWKKHKEIQELRQQIEEIKKNIGDSKKILSDTN